MKLLCLQSADAATEVAQVAGDSRVGVIATLFVPIVGWVLFNIGGAPSRTPPPPPLPDHTSEDGRLT